MYRLYETQGGWIQVAGVSDGAWAGLCRAVGRAELATDPRGATAEARVQHRAALEAELEEIFRTDTALRWRRRLDDAGVPAEIAVDTVDGESVLFDEENLRLGLVAEYDHPRFGRMRQVGSLIRFSETPGRIAGPPPMAGQHTREILAELGYGAAAIADLEQRGLVRSV
jgi:crotonobetainyl-CoA:carnitine CoA-transferase CaiB-like acyl-CoA transferase